MFPLVNERLFSEKNYEHLMNTHKLELAKLNKKPIKSPKFIEEPQPQANHLYCQICKCSFKLYLEHIFSI